MSSRAVQASSFVAQLAKLRFPNVFNPYSDTCAEHDLPGAPAIRRNNLQAVMAGAMQRQTSSLWIGLELGRGGGRRTGLAMTDDAHLAIHAERFAARGVKRATKSGPASEITAGIVWSKLLAINELVFLWNIFPLHPHRPGATLSNRRHGRQEREHCRQFLDAILSMLTPATIVAIGIEAQVALGDYGCKFYPVRHPAYGGKSDFVRGIDAVYRT
jgi:hypothetical protein